MSISPRGQHIEYLDGLRGIAVLMVIGHHAIARFDKPFIWDQLRPWLKSGFHGVSLFFILSAFTLFASSNIRFFSEDRPVIKFYLRRAFRILPFFWLNILLGAFIMPTSFTNILANATFTFGFLIPTTTIYAIVPGSWSLVVEETFYLLFPLFFFRYLKKIHWAFCGLLFFILIKFIWQNFMLRNGHNESLPIVWTSPFYNYHWFFFGILLAHYQIHRGENKLLAESKVNLPLLLDSVLLVSLIYINKFDDLTVALILCFLIYSASFSNTLIGKICRTKILRLFGICCYSIYFIHFYVIVWLEPYLVSEFNVQSFQHAPNEIQFFIYTFLVAFISLFLGILSFVFIEIPSVQLGSKIILGLKSKINLKTCIS